MKKYPEKLADGRELLQEVFDSLTLGSVEALSECVRGVCLIEAGLVSESFRLNEAEAPNGTLGTIEGVFAKADIINKNRRFYSKVVYELAVGRAQAALQARNFLGEVDHPDYGGSLKGGAFRFTKIWMDGDLGRFEGVLLDTDGGKHLGGLIKGGVGVQVSTRGYASSSVEKRTINGVEVPITIIGTDLTFEGIDFVLNASNPAGRVTSAKTESASADVTTETGMNLAELREKHPDLVAQIETAAREGFVAQADVATQVEAARTAERVVVLADKDLVASKTALEAILAAVKPLLPAPLATESENVAEVATLRGQVETLTTEVTGLKKEKEDAEKARKEAECKAEADRKEAERKAAVTAKVDEVLKGYVHEDLIRNELLKAESVEAVTTLFESRKTLIESASARAAAKPAPAGTGTAETKTPEQTSAAVANEVKRRRRIAGLE